MGLVLLALEELTNLAFGQAPLPGDELLRLLPFYLGVPAAAALLAGRRATPDDRLLAAVMGTGALVFGAVGSMMLRERGLPGPPAFALAALVLAGLLRSLPPRPRLTRALGLSGLFFLPTVRAVHLNAFGSPFEAGALAMTGLLAGLGLLLALAAPLLPAGRRRALLGGLVVLAAALLSLARAPQAPRPAAPAARPDLVLVVIDTLRADHLGLYGYARPTSPGLDALAGDCLVYDDATSSAPWTLPSFGSLLTGLEPHAHGAGLNPGERNTQAPLAAGPPTVAERLGAAGYRTGAVVSNPYLKASFGLGRGFDHYDDALGLAHMMMLLHPLDQLPLRVLPDRSYRLAPRMVEAARRFWADTAGGPRFLLLHLMDPHKPYNPPAEDRAAIPAGPDPEKDLYDAEIRFADRHLAPFLRERLAEGATVLLTADHGEEFDDHPGAYPGERWPPDVRHGHTLYQEQLHVPLLACRAGLGGARVVRPVRSLDVAPTLLALGGAQPIEHHGQPLAELLGQAPPPPLPRRAQAIRYGTEKRAVIDTDGAKLIESRAGEELYLLAEDPGERSDRAAAQPERRAGLRLLLPAQGQAEAAELDAATLEALRAVGYVDE